MAEKLSVLMDMYISSEAVRVRFKKHIGVPVPDEEMVEEETFKDELRGFVREFPECMSKIRGDIL